MPHSEQLRLVLPNETVSRLNLTYEPFHWPGSDVFPEYGGFSIQKPWEGYKHKKWYAADREPYDRLQKLLAPYNEKWVEATCIAALVPDAGGNNFSLLVNGMTLSDSLYESERLHKLMCQRKMRFLITTCNARISGGGIMPDGRSRGYGIGINIPALREVDAIKRQRNKEKQEFFKRFRLRAIEDIYKNKFFALFDHRCFKCGIKEKAYSEIGQPPALCIDHHIPMILGGHSVTGNLVALCRICNNKKRDLPPEEFYTSEELNKLKPILDKQSDIFNFTFDWDYWNKDRKGYLLSLGIEPNLVHELLYNHEHPDFIGTQSDNIGVIISVDFADIYDNMKERK